MTNPTRLSPEGEMMTVMVSADQRTVTVSVHPTPPLRMVEPSRTTSPPAESHYEEGYIQGLADACGTRLTAEDLARIICESYGGDPDEVDPLFHSAAGRRTQAQRHLRQAEAILEKVIVIAR